MSPQPLKVIVKVVKNKSGIIVVFHSNVILNKEYGRFLLPKNKQNSRKVCHKVNSIMEKLTEM